MENPTQNLELRKTSDLIDAVNSHPFRCEEIPLETALSLPVLVLDGGHPTIGFFYYSVGGPFDNRVVGPPSHKVIVNASNLEQIQFIPVTPQEMGLDVAPDQALEKIELVPRKEGVESYDYLMNQLCITVDHLFQFYPKSPDLLNEAEKQYILTYKTLFNKLVKKSLIPAYKALSPQFFDWLGS